MKNDYTRLRVYKLLDGGVTSSLLIDNSLSLIGARYNETIALRIKSELSLTGARSISVLHIPGWNQSFCKSEELSLLLRDLEPVEIEIPRFEPYDENGVLCKKIINEYVRNSVMSYLTVCGKDTDSSDIDCNEDITVDLKKTSADIQDQYVIKMFRQGRFSVLSTGLSVKNLVEKQLQDLCEQKGIDILLIRDKDCDFFKSSNFLNETLIPACIVLEKPEISVLVHKEAFHTKRGIEIFKTPDGDFVFSSGTYKGTENVKTSKNFFTRSTYVETQ